MNTSGFGGAETGSVNAASKRHYEYPKVTNQEAHMEPVVPFDRFGLERITDVPVTHMLYGATKEKPQEDEPTEVQGYDYTKQLAFHKQEVADAPKRGMPEAQVDYHIGKVAVLENIPHPPQGPPPEVKKCLHTECDCE